MNLFCRSAALVAVLLTNQSAFADITLSLKPNADGDIELFATSDEVGGTNISTINLHLTSNDCTFESWTPEGPLSPAAFFADFSSGMAVSGGSGNFSGGGTVGENPVLIATIDVQEEIKGSNSCFVQFVNGTSRTDLGTAGAPIALDQRVSAVPEPSSWLFLALISCVFGGRAYWTKLKR